MEPWGPDAVRVRARLGGPVLDGLPGALLDEPPATESTVKIDDAEGQLTVGALTVHVDAEGQIRFLRTRGLHRAPRGGTRPLLVARARASTPRSASGHHRLEQRFAAYDDEKLYGLGQHQHGQLRPEGPGPRPGPAQRRGRHPGALLQPRLHPPVEQPGDRPRGAGRTTAPAGWPTRPARSTTGSPRAHPADGQRRYSAVTGPYADAAGVGGGLLAVQAALPHPGRTPRGGTGVQAPGAAHLRHRLRLLPLDAPGRLEVRPEPSGPTRRRWCASWRSWASSWW